MKQMLRTLFIFYGVLPLPDPCVVVTPVIDATTKSVAATCSDVAAYYSQLPYSPEVGRSRPLRDHQFLYNEIVTCIGGTDDELYIDAPQAQYLAHDVLQSTYYVRNQGLVPIRMLPYDVQQAIPGLSDLPTLVLQRPWTEHKRTFSAGTRFVYDAHATTPTHYIVRYYDHERKQLITGQVAQELVYESKAQAPDEALDEFVALLRLWASADPYIPYVYGGCSYGVSCTGTPQLVSCEFCGEQGTEWHRQGSTDHLKVGMDCSNMVFRAANIVGFRLPYKNTRTIASHLQQIPAGEPLQNGDLIYVPGHMCVVSDVKKQLLIEAGGYAAGYGRVHEISLKDYFHELGTYEALQHRYAAQAPVVIIPANREKLLGPYNVAFYRLHNVPWRFPS